VDNNYNLKIISYEVRVGVRYLIILNLRTYHALLFDFFLQGVSGTTH